MPFTSKKPEFLLSILTNKGFVLNYLIYRYSMKTKREKELKLSPIVCEELTIR